MPLGPNHRDKDVTSSAGRWGQLLAKYVDLQFSGVFADRLCLYLASWVLAAVNEWLRRRHARLPAAYIRWVMRLHPVLHFRLGSVIFADALFYGIRTLLHAT